MTVAKPSSNRSHHHGGRQVNALNVAPNQAAFVISAANGIYGPQYPAPCNEAKSAAAAIQVGCSEWTQDRVATRGGCFHRQRRHTAGRAPPHSAVPLSAPCCLLHAGGCCESVAKADRERKRSWGIRPPSPVTSRE